MAYGTIFADMNSCINTSRRAFTESIVWLLINDNTLFCNRYWQLGKESWLFIDNLPAEHWILIFSCGMPLAFKTFKILSNISLTSSHMISTIWRWLAAMDCSSGLYLRTLFINLLRTWCERTLNNSTFEGFRVSFSRRGALWRNQISALSSSDTNHLLRTKVFNLLNAGHHSKSLL